MNYAFFSHSRIPDFINLCKPRVIALMLVTAMVGMLFAAPSLLSFTVWKTMVIALCGIALCAASAAIINHLVDRRIDALMLRTHKRPIVMGRITPTTAFLFSTVLGLFGVVVLFFYVNPLTTLLSVLTLFSYAILYTLFLKRATPQNIVIGGIAGAMPPLLGWSAISNSIHPQALLLVLIIFVWTPPHFWALAIHRYEDYRKANIPMLPVTHGIPYTKLCILLYTLLLFAVTLLPFITGMSGLIYFIAALLLNIVFLVHTLRLYTCGPQQASHYALNTFRFSIIYLSLLFIALFIDLIFNTR